MRLGVAVVLSAGCSNADTGGPVGGMGQTTGLTGADGASVTGTSDPGEMSSGTGGTSGGTSEPGMPEALCDYIDCGPNGSCTVVDGLPACMCASGYVDVGLQCKKCSPVGDGQTVDLDVAPDSVSVQLEFRINDAPIEPTATDMAEILLWNRVTGDEVLLGTAYDGLLEGQALPGTYDVIYRVVESSGRIPRNVRAVLGHVTTSTDDSIPTFDASPRFVNLVLTIDGQTPPTDTGEFGEIVLERESNPQDAFVVGTTADGTISVPLLPGRYRVRYRAVETLGTSRLPSNPDLVLPTYVYVSDNQGQELPTTVPVEIATVRASFAVTLDGMAPPESQTERGRLVLVDPVTGARIPIGTTEAAGGIVSTGRVAATTYDVYYTVDGSVEGKVPENRWAKVDTVAWDGLSGDIEVPRAIALTSAKVTIEPTLGPNPVTPADGVAEIWLRSDEGDEVFVGRTDDADLSATVLPGTYHVVYRVVSPGSALPHDTAGHLDTIVVSAGAPVTRSVDLTPAVLSGALTLASGPAPDSQYESGTVYLYDPSTGNRIVLATTADGSYARRVLPNPGAELELRYGVEEGGEVVPANADAVLDAPKVSIGPGPTNLDVALDSATLDFSPNFGGAPVPLTTEWATFWLRHVETGDRFPVGSTLAPTTREVLPGRYAVEYTAVEASDVLPWNTRGVVTCIDVP